MAGGGLGPHVGGARGRQNGLDGTLVRAGALFCWDVGIQGKAKVGGDLRFLAPTVYQSNIRQSAIRLGK